MNDHFTILQTKRLRLKRLEKSDILALTNIWCDPEVTQFMGGPRERVKLEDIFKEDVKDPFGEVYDLWPVEEKKTAKTIGHCGLLEKEVKGNPEIELIYVFSSAAWGKGYAIEIGTAIKRFAFDEMGITRLIALIDPENKASERVALKIGMQFESELVRSEGVKRMIYVVENLK